MTSDGRGDRGANATTATADSFLRDLAAAPERPTGLEQDSSQLATGALIAERFRLEKQLGEGGMGVVWAARHLVTRKPVALKFVKHASRDSPETRQRFLREARAACAVRHPSVVEVHDVLELEDGSPVMVMDLLVGESMAQRLARERSLPLGEVARIMVPVCAGVGSAHALGIVHRDLKPDNIFLCIEGDGTTSVKVLDFGIAKLTATEGDAAHTGESTNTGMLLGTPFYMAPEQMFGEKNIDHRADLWAIGVILYEALTGQRPTQGANLGQILKVVAKEKLVPLRELAPSLPEPVLDLVGKLLEMDRDRRPSDLHEVVAVLSKHTSAQAEPFGAPRAPQSSGALTPVGAKASTPSTSSQPARRLSMPAVVGGLAIMGAGVASVAIFGRSSTVAPVTAAQVGSAAIAAPISAPSVTAGTTPSASPEPPAAASVAVAAPTASAPSAAQASTAARPPATRSRTATATSGTAPTTAPPAPSAAPSPAPKPSAATPKISEDL